MLHDEKNVENLQSSYEVLIRERYQEELLVAERNRGLSNILTWTLLMANMSIFGLSLLFVEPRRIAKIREVVKNEMHQTMSVIKEDIKNITTILVNTSESSKVSTEVTNETKMKIEQITDKIDDSIPIQLPAIPVVIIEDNDGIFYMKICIFMGITLVCRVLLSQ